MKVHLYYSDFKILFNCMFIKSLHFKFPKMIGDIYVVKLQQVNLSKLD